MTSKEKLVEYLVNTGVLKTQEIIKAFNEIDRADFVPKEYLNEAYEDHPLPIDRGQTISQPTTVALMLELLQPKVGDKILDIGAGSGWTTALLAQIVGSKGIVLGVEIVLELFELGRKNLEKYNFSNAEILQANEVVGLKKEAPFDKILVSAAGEELPQELVDQLKVGGRMVIPIKNSVWKIDKVSESEIKKDEYPGFVFVPLK